VRHTDSIYAERKTFRNVPPIFSRLKIQPELVSDRYQFALRDKSGPLRIAHLNAKFSAALLRGNGKNQKAGAAQKSDGTS
jgi:hypothetical protein